jgi:hypothetical protein
MTCALKPFNKTFCIVEGYPELVGTRQAQIIKHRHFRIDGHPATVVMVEDRIGSTRFCQSVLLVHVPEQAMLYAVFGEAEVSKFAQVNAEMQAIISSFHIEQLGTKL